MNKVPTAERFWRWMGQKKQVHLTTATWIMSGVQRRVWLIIAVLWLPACHLLHGLPIHPSISGRRGWWLMSAPDCNKTRRDSLSTTASRHPTCKFGLLVMWRPTPHGEQNVWSAFHLGLLTALAFLRTINIYQPYITPFLNRVSEVRIYCNKNQETVLLAVVSSKSVVQNSCVNELKQGQPCNLFLHLQFVKLNVKYATGDGLIRQANSTQRAAVCLRTENDGECSSVDVDFTNSQWNGWSAFSAGPPAVMQQQPGILTRRSREAEHPWKWRVLRVSPMTATLHRSEITSAVSSFRRRRKLQRVSMRCPAASMRRTSR